MTGAKLHSIGRQTLTVALLILAALAYMTTVISSLPPPAVVKPVTTSVPAAHGTSATDAGALPDACSSNANDRPLTRWKTPPALLEGMDPFCGKNGDEVYDTYILEAARCFEMDPAVLKAVIMAESGFNPRAVSRAGAQGLMQLMPRTAHSLGVEDIFDPRTNILAGTRYLKKLLRRFDGNIELALAAYNAGSRNVLRHNGIPPFKTTRRYIAKIKLYYQHYRHQDFDIIS